MPSLLDHQDFAISLALRAKEKRDALIVGWIKDQLGDECDVRSDDFRVFAGCCLIHSESCEGTKEKCWVTVVDDKAREYGFEKHCGKKSPIWEIAWE